MFNKNLGSFAWALLDEPILAQHQWRQTSIELLSHSNSNGLQCLFLYLSSRSLCFQFLLPVIQISLMCVCIGGDPKGVRVAVVNNETSSSGYSQLLLGFLDNSSIEQVVVPLNKNECLINVIYIFSWGIHESQYLTHKITMRGYL